MHSVCLCRSLCRGIGGARSPRTVVCACIIARDQQGWLVVCVCTLEHVSWQGWRRGCLVRRTPSEPSPAWTLPCQPEPAGGLQAKCSQNLHLWWMVLTLKTASFSSSLTIVESIQVLPLVLLESSSGYSHSKLGGYQPVSPNRPLCNILMIQIICKQIDVLDHPLYRRPGSEPKKRPSKHRLILGR